MFTDKPIINQYVLNYEYPIMTLEEWLAYVIDNVVISCDEVVAGFIGKYIGDNRQHNVLYCKDLPKSSMKLADMFLNGVMDKETIEYCFNQIQLGMLVTIKSAAVVDSLEFVNSSTINSESQKEKNRIRISKDNFVHNEIYKCWERIRVRDYPTGTLICDLQGQSDFG